MSRPKISAVLITLLPMVFVLFVTIWAMFKNLIYFWTQKDEILIFLSILILALTLILLVGGMIALFRKQSRIAAET